MADFEAPENDALEQEQSPEDATAPVPEETETALEVSEGDAAEQQRVLRDGPGRQLSSVPDEADEADAADQAYEVEMDEDEYR